MLRSMTGYGRAEQVADSCVVVAEVISLNRRHLEINLQIPQVLQFIDLELRKKIARLISRGNITLKLFVTFSQNAPYALKPNLALAKQAKEAWGQIAREIGVKADVSLELLNALPDMLIMVDTSMENQTEQVILETVERAIGKLLEEKNSEGFVLQKDISNRLDLMGSWMGKIAENAKEGSTKYRKKLLERLQEVLGNTGEIDERILKEVALYAERVDISEEIVRFGAHLENFKGMLTSQDIASGKNLEFLLQELQREINTIGSKSGDIAINSLVINVKSELEKVREQTHNIE